MPNLISESVNILRDDESPNIPQRDLQGPDLPTNPTTLEVQAHGRAVAIKQGRRAPKYKGIKHGKVQRDGEKLSSLAGLVQVFGTVEEGILSHLVAQVANTVPYGEQLGKNNLKYVSAALHGIAPQDPLEGLLAVQMVGVHNLAMEFLKRAALKNQTAYGVDVNVNRATRFLRTFAMQVEALKRYRSKGEQRVQVEHVHVSRGGQAIVGSVNHTNAELRSGTKDQH